MARIWLLYQPATRTLGRSSSYPAKAVKLDVSRPPPEDAYSFDWSPEGDPLVFESGGYLRVISASGGSALQLTKGPGRAPAWSLDGSRVYFMGFGEREGNIWEVQADGSGERAVTDLGGRRGKIGIDSPFTDGKYLYFIWTEDLGDIWVMDVVTEEP